MPPPRTAERPGSATILRRWIIWSTYLGCFSAGLFFEVGSVHLLFLYPVIILNLVLLVLMGYLWFPPGLLFLLGFTLFSGIVGLFQGTDSLPLLLKSLVGIWLESIYVCAFLRYMKFDAVDCFRLYARAAYYVAMVGLCIYPLQLVFQGMAARLHSFEIEPGEFCVVCVPAIYYFADRWQRLRVDGWKVVLMLVTVALSRSSIGFMGLFLSIYIFGRRYRFGSVLAPILIVVVGAGIYAVSPDFQMRLSDSVSGFVLLDGSDLNQSSWALFSAALVAVKALQVHPLLGEGLGGISLVNLRYIATVPGADAVPLSALQVASGDGGSLLFRLAGETGLVGLGLSFAFLRYCYPREPTVEQRQTALAILVYSFLKLLRSGPYLNPEVLFLFTVYAVNGSHVMAAMRSRFQSLWYARQPVQVRGLVEGEVAP